LSRKEKEQEKKKKKKKDIRAYMVFPFGLFETYKSLHPFPRSTHYGKGLVSAEKSKKLCD
jgi:hypothetical protein